MVLVLEGLQYLFAPDRPRVEILRDFADIFIVAFILYRALLVLKGTRAMQMGLGFLAFGVLYILAKYAELATLMQVLSWLASSAILILVVVFQNDIRRALIRVGSKAWLARTRDAQERVIEDVVSAATELARHRIGALICLERDANVLEFVQNDGIELDALVTKDLLVSLFIPESQNKTHDGAVLIRDLRIARAGIFFPMPESTKVTDATLGSRHRAAIAITEETDAVVIVVSEERGAISMVSKDGELEGNLSGDNLKERLLEMFGRSPKGVAKLALERARTKPPPPPLSVKPVSEKRAGDKKAGDKKDIKPAESAERKVDSIRPAAPTRASVPPPSERPTSPKLADAKKVTRQSGGFRALPRDETTDEIPVAARVSVPMPSSKDRKSADTAERATLSSNEDESPTAPRSKPMTPTELPNANYSPHGEEP